MMPQQNIIWDILEVLPTISDWDVQRNFVCEIATFTANETTINTVGNHNPHIHSKSIRNWLCEIGHTRWFGAIETE